MSALNKRNETNWTERALEVKAPFGPKVWRLKDGILFVCFH